MVKNNYRDRKKLKIVFLILFLNLNNYKIQFTETIFVIFKSYIQIIKFNFKER